LLRASLLPYWALQDSFFFFLFLSVVVVFSLLAFNLPLVAFSLSLFVFDTGKMRRDLLGKRTPGGPPTRNAAALARKRDARTPLR
jgi:hypothetical protein